MVAAHRCAPAGIRGRSIVSFIKALIPGTLLAWILSTVIGSNGSQGGWTAIHRVTIEGFQFWWSWPIFIAGTALSWFVFKALE